LAARFFLLDWPDRSKYLVLTERVAWGYGMAGVSMSRSLAVLFLLVGREGSKGLPGKNLREIAGLSLIGYKAVSAKKSPNCNRLIVSSDSSEIQAEARRWGAEVLFMRPAELATDTATSDQVVLHAMEWIEKNEAKSYDAIMLLEPSSPFARPDHYDAAIELFVKQEADLVVGLRETEVSSLYVGSLGANGSIAQIVEKILSRTNLRRQDQPPEVTMNGALYLIRWNALKKRRKIYSNPAKTFGILMDRLHSIEIESPVDFAFATSIVEKGLLDVSAWR
jgi:N-acylneuraminate cytidylyltransferase/CMP-N,N'-diacetyllegionaminic acid synthase